jgi:hypothetical protein
VDLPELEAPAMRTTTNWLFDLGSLFVVLRLPFLDRGSWLIVIRHWSFVEQRSRLEAYTMDRKLQQLNIAGSEGFEPPSPLGRPAFSRMQKLFESLL